MLLDHFMKPQHHVVIRIQRIVIFIHGVKPPLIGILFLRFDTGDLFFLADDIPVRQLFVFPGLEGEGRLFFMVALRLKGADP